MKDLSAKLTCAVTAVALILSFVAYLSLDDSLAWFANNQEVSAQGMSVSVKGTNYTVTLESYGVIDIQDNAYMYDTAKGQCFELPTYDVQGISYSEYSKALIVVITVQSNLTEDKNLNVRLVTTGNRDFDWISPNVFSNCMQITPAQSNESGKVTKNGDTLSFLTLQEDQDQQATLTKNSNASTNGLDLGTIIIAQGDNVTTTAYYIIEYDDDFVTMLTSGAFAGSGEVTYTSDIHFILE